MTPGARPVLWQIRISHYSEKARWALSYKGVDHVRRSPPPGAHMPVSLWLTRGRSYTFPVLELGGRRIGDSSEIIRALEEAAPDPPLIPHDDAQAVRALELEDWFDEELGPQIRRLAFHELTRDPEILDQIVALQMPRAIAGVRGLPARLGGPFVRLRYKAGSSELADTARDRVLAACDRLELELGDGEYLVGDRFTVADLTAAALMSPLVRPPGAPEIPALPGPFLAFQQEHAGRRAFTWVNEMYSRHRGAP